MTPFIDTNVLVYAQGSGAKSEKARQVILAGGVISVQVLNEFAAVLSRKLRCRMGGNRRRAGRRPGNARPRASS